MKVQVNKDVSLFIRALLIKRIKDKVGKQDISIRKAQID